jgi:hypothetical protein
MMRDREWLFGKNVSFYRLFVEQMADLRIEAWPHILRHSRTTPSFFWTAKTSTGSRDCLANTAGMYVVAIGYVADMAWRHLSPG